MGRLLECLKLLVKFRTKCAIFFEAQRERIGFEQHYKRRDLIWLVEGILGTEEEIGMKSVSEQVSQNKCGADEGKRLTGTHVQNKAWQGQA